MDGRGAPFNSTLRSSQLRCPLYLNTHCFCFILLLESTKLFLATKYQYLIYQPQLVDTQCIVILFILRPLQHLFLRVGRIWGMEKHPKCAVHVLISNYHQEDTSACSVCFTTTCDATCSLFLADMPMIMFHIPE